MKLYFRQLTPYGERDDFAVAPIKLSSAVSMAQMCKVFQRDESSMECRSSCKNHLRWSEIAQLLPSYKEARKSCCLLRKLSPHSERERGRVSARFVIAIQFMASIAQKRPQLFFAIRTPPLKALHFTVLQCCLCTFQKQCILITPLPAKFLQTWCNCKKANHNTQVAWNHKVHLYQKPILRQKTCWPSSRTSGKSIVSS